MKGLKEVGAQTIAQSEKSCVVFGMPKAAIELQCVDHIEDLSKIPNKLIKLINGRANTKTNNSKGVA